MFKNVWFCIGVLRRIIVVKEIKWINENCMQHAFEHLVLSSRLLRLLNEDGRYGWDMKDA
jgi:hypothetical protein